MQNHLTDSPLPFTIKFTEKVIKNSTFGMNNQFISYAKRWSKTRGR